MLFYATITMSTLIRVIISENISTETDVFYEYISHKC